MTTEQEYIYAIAHPHGYVKIGRSNDPQQRLRDHQISSPYELWIVVQFPVADSKSVESQLHAELSETRVRREWFELSYGDYDDLIDMVKMAALNGDFESLDEFRAWQQRKREAML